jgi:hypothetical protein
MGMILGLAIIIQKENGLLLFMELEEIKVQKKFKEL